MIAGSRVECVFFGQSLARLSEIQCRSELRRTVGRPISELGSAGVEGLPSVHQWLRGWAFTVANAGRGSWTKKGGASRRHGLFYACVPERAPMPTMNRFGFLVVALSLAGCGTVWVDGSYLQRPPFVKGTVEVEARAEASRAEGIQIVEQPSGQGFIVDPEGDRLRRSALSAHVAVDVEVRSAARCAGCSDGADGELGAWGDSIVMEEASESSRSIGESSGLPESAMASAAIAVGPLADEGVAGVGVVSSDVHVGGLEVWGAQVGERGTGSSAINRESLGAVGLALEALEIEARASVARQGVWGLDGRSTAITAITGPGVQVDGVRVALDELEALATLPMPGPASARLVTDGAIEAWAELEHESLPRSGGETPVVVRVRAASSVSTTPRPSVRVHLVIDASSSMQRSWTRMLDAARELIARLAADDELQIVAYGTDAVEVFPVGRVADGRAALAALERVAVGGGTNIQAGLERAYAAASGSARSLVILLSDGVPTRGAFEPAEFGGLASAGRARGAITSVVGLGTEFDDRLLRAVAKSGHGGYHVSASPDELATGLLEELEAHA